MTTFQLAGIVICALGGGAGIAAFLRAPAQNRRDKADSTGLIVDAAVDVSELQRTMISDLEERLTKAEAGARQAEERAQKAETRAQRAEATSAALTARVAELEEQVAELRNGHS